MSVKETFNKTFIEKTDRLWPQFLRYIWVGALTTLIDVAILNTLTFGFGVNERVSAATGYMTGVFVNYFICIFWIFPSDKSRRIFEFVASMTAGLVGMFLNDCIIKAGTAWLPEWSWLGGLLTSFGLTGELSRQAFFLNTSKAVSTIVVLAWNFLARKYLIFRKTTK
ncbi:MAG: GtrA family protein [Candidatus Brocadiia bacterium]